MTSSEAENNGASVCVKTKQRGCFFPKLSCEIRYGNYLIGESEPELATDTHTHTHTQTHARNK